MLPAGLQACSLVAIAVPASGSGYTGWVGALHGWTRS